MKMLFYTFSSLSPGVLASQVVNSTLLDEQAKDTLRDDKGQLAERIFKFSDAFAKRRKQ